MAKAVIRRYVLTELLRFFPALAIALPPDVPKNKSAAIRRPGQIGVADPVNVDPTPASFTWLVAANIPPIPALGEAILALLALLVGAAGLLARRRRN